jgi:2-methylcitrate dehydratase
MLLPDDYDDEALLHPLTRALMDRIEFAHGGRKYDAKYPDGIPTSLDLDHARLGRFSSGLVMYPAGHARCTALDWSPVLAEKFRRLAKLGGADAQAVEARLANLGTKTVEEVKGLYW